MTPTIPPPTVQHPHWDVTITKRQGTQSLVRTMMPIRAIFATCFTQPIVDDNLRDLPPAVTGDSLYLDFTNPEDLMQLAALLEHALNNASCLESITLEVLPF